MKYQKEKQKSLCCSGTNSWLSNTAVLTAKPSIYRKLPGRENHDQFAFTGNNERVVSHFASAVT